MEYLGVIIDSHLKWNLYIQQVIKKLGYILYKFRKMKGIVQIEYLKNLHFLLVESHLCYVICVWG